MALKGSIDEMLSKRGLSTCIAGLRAEGVEKAEELLELTEEDIVELSTSYRWKLLHRRRLLTVRAKLLGKTPKNFRTCLQVPGM